MLDIKKICILALILFNAFTAFSFIPFRLIEFIFFPYEGEWLLTQHTSLYFSEYFSGLILEILNLIDISIYLPINSNGTGRDFLKLLGVNLDVSLS